MGIYQNYIYINLKTKKLVMDIYYDKDGIKNQETL